MMRARRAATLVLLTCLLCPLSAGADEDELGSLVQRLRSEPLSLFDWGMFALEEELQRVRRNPLDFVRAQYLPARRQILIDSVFLIEAGEIDHVGAEKACYTRLHAIKLLLGFIDTDKIHRAPAWDFRLGMKFSHRDSDAFPELPDAARVGAALAEAIYLKVGVAEDKAHFPFNQAMHCESRLVDQDVVYRQSTNEDLGPK